jgi:hypothetical protein
VRPWQCSVPCVWLTAARAGMLAGAFFGLSGIKQSWQDALAMRSLFVVFTDELLRLVRASACPAVVLCLSQECCLLD